MDGRATLITGAASGIGRHLTGALAREGYRVLATDANERALEAAQDEERWPSERVQTRALDVRDEAGWEAAVDAAELAFGPLDLLLNVAGVLKVGSVLDMDAADLDLMLAVNVRGVVLGTRTAARRMVRRRSGHIVNVGSMASLAAVPGLSGYGASKFAVRAYSLAAATELSPHGVAVSLLLPDAVETPMLDQQRGREEAALTFSGARALTVMDLERVLFDVVIPKRPLEVALPRGRAFLAKSASAMPSLAKLLYPMLRKKGLAAQRRAR